MVALNCRSQFFLFKNDIFMIQKDVLHVVVYKKFSSDLKYLYVL